MESISQEIITEVSYHLLVRTATKYPKNFLNKLVQRLRKENNPGPKSVIASIIENILDAAEESVSLCQDTGLPTFHVYLNPGLMIKGDIEHALNEATIRATEEVPIRRNVVEPFTFQNPGNNVGWGSPFIHYHWDPCPSPMKIRAELKGFGGEIKSASDWIFTSTKNMEDAVLAYTLNTVLLSKGEGCIPGFLGIGVGGYMSEAAINAKNAVFRELTSVDEAHTGQNEIILKRIEDRIFRCVNRLGLGPMGCGGKTTTLGVYLDRKATHTAVAPVSVSQQCWASRASEALITDGRASYITPHVEAEDAPVIREAISHKYSASGDAGKIYFLNTPVDPDVLQKLRIWDVVYLSGIICTSRDGAHKRMVELVRAGKVNEIPEEIRKSGVIYHCGPIFKECEDGLNIRSAGPTTSSRFTIDAALLAEQGILRIAIGKGTMGGKMIHALRGKGVYLKAVGGCAVVYKKMIKRTDVKWLDLGYPEAAWIFKVETFGPLVVGIDSTGNSLNNHVMNEVYQNARQVYQEEGLNPEISYIQYPQTFAGLSLEETIDISKKR